MTRRSVNRGCQVLGCGAAHRSKGLCSKHYERMRKHGTTVLRTERNVSVRGIEIHDGIAFVPLTRGYVARIDPEDVEKVRCFNWSVQIRPRTCYAIRTPRKNEQGTRAHMLLHRLIMDAPEDTQVDHISGDGLDCRKQNLRLATSEDNARNARRRRDNQSGYKGVSWHKQRRKWVAQLNIDGKRKHLGLFICPKEAHAVYCDAVERLHGEFARTE